MVKYNKEETVSVPRNGHLGPIQIANDIWIVRKLFSLGANQKEERITLKEGEGNESTREELEEERQNAGKLLDGENIPFLLDTTMTIIRDPEDNSLILHSVVEPDEHLMNQVSNLGRVKVFLAPNLQHWLFLDQWLKAFPDANLGVVPSAFDEDLEVKLKDSLKDHRGKVFEVSEDKNQLKVLECRLLKGAPLSLNEYLFFHKSSGTMIASDSFYGGYCDNEKPSWFARMWFKLTKDGSFRAARLPIYRTSRVVSHGSPDELFQSVEEMIARWSIDQIVFAHGSSPFNAERMIESGNESLNSVGDVYLSCWKSGIAAVEAKQ